MGKRVALYPGSFNPMHVGHVAIARWLVECGSFDEVRLMPSPHNPLKPSSSSPSSDWHERLEAIRQACMRNNLDIAIEDIEFHLPEPHYTYRTLEALHKREPDTAFVLVIGADNLAIIDKWYRGREILAGHEIWVYPRKGYDTGRLIEEAYAKGALGIRKINAPLIEISSTEIRNAEARGDLSMEKFKA